MVVFKWKWKINMCTYFMDKNKLLHHSKLIWDACLLALLYIGVIGVGLLFYFSHYVCWFQLLSNLPYFDDYCIRSCFGNPKLQHLSGFLQYTLISCLRYMSAVGWATALGGLTGFGSAPLIFSLGNAGWRSASTWVTRFSWPREECSEKPESHLKLLHEGGKHVVCSHPIGQSMPQGQAKNQSWGPRLSQ